MLTTKVNPLPTEIQPPTPNHNNKTTIEQTLQTRAPSKHSQMMLSELINESKTGRICGPFLPPVGWNINVCSQIDTDDGPIFPQTCPDSMVAMAIALAIEQIGSDGNDKVRRGEDWLRGLQNGTIRIGDSPFHHTVDHYINIARHVWEAEQTTTLNMPSLQETKQTQQPSRHMHGKHQTASAKYICQETPTNLGRRPRRSIQTTPLEKSCRSISSTTY